MLLPIEVHVVRHGEFYFYNQWRGGVQEVIGERISVDRARQIVESGDGAAETSSRGQVQFEPGGGVEFSYLAKFFKEMPID